MKVKSLSPMFYAVALVAVFLGSNLALVPVKADTAFRIWDQCDSGETAWENQSQLCDVGYEQIGVNPETAQCLSSSSDWCSTRGYGGGCTEYSYMCRLMGNGGENWCSHYGGPCNDNTDCCPYAGSCSWNSGAYAYTCGGA
jgi:hypothetical protein